MAFHNASISKCVWGTFECIGENTEKYKIFSFPIEKEEVIEIDKDGYENVATTSYKIKFIDSARFMATSLSNTVDNLTEGIHKIKSKDSEFFLEYKCQRQFNKT